MTDLEARIVTLLVEETGTRKERVRMCSRLREDIGMDGDDAVEFFEKFGDRFNVDLTDLHDRWGQHFSPEGLFTGGVPGYFAVSITVQDLVDAAISSRWVKRYHEPGFDLFRTFDG
jgi:hypothetical protein